VNGTERLLAVAHDLFGDLMEVWSSYIEIESQPASQYREKKKKVPAVSHWSGKSRRRVVSLDVP